MMRSLVRRLKRAEGGGTAMEFAFVLPAFLVVLVGGLSLGQLALASNSLHYAVQDASRCAAVKTTVCTDPTTTVSYAEGRYSGPQISPTFTYSTAGCGHTVTASATYPVLLAVTTVNVPISASSCYP